jgi:hypothetical protein
VVEVTSGFIEELDLRFPSINIRCHRNCLSLILVASKCKQYFSSTLGGFESLLLHPMSIWSDNRWQIGSNGVCYSFSLGPRCATRIFQAHPMVVNPLTRLWRVINTFQLPSPTFPECLKLAEIAMTHILGSIEDEWCFNSVSFLKDKVCICLNPHCN